MLAESLVGAPELHESKLEDFGEVLPEEAIAPGMIIVADGVAEEETDKVPEVEVFLGQDVF
jgi:hypothetical protein